MFHYTVTYFDTYENKTITEKGLLAAIDYGEAANKLVKFYGEEHVDTIGLAKLEDILTEQEVIDEFNHE